MYISSSGLQKAVVAKWSLLKPFFSLWNKDFYSYSALCILVQSGGQKINCSYYKHPESYGRSSGVSKQNQVVALMFMYIRQR